MAAEELLTVGDQERAVSEADTLTPTDAREPALCEASASYHTLVTDTRAHTPLLLFSGFPPSPGRGQAGVAALCPDAPRLGRPWESGDRWPPRAS